MTRQPRIQISYRVIRDEGDTIVVTPINDEIRIKKPLGVKLHSCLTAEIKELKPVPEYDRPSYWGKTT